MNPYIVKSGDTLSTIAQRNGLTLQQLIALNPQFASNPNLIKPGQTVNLTGAGGGPVASTTGGGKTQAQVDAEYAAAAAAHPALAGNSAEAISYATSTGDFSGLVNAQGQPFSTADQRAAVDQATADLLPYYAAEQKKETADTEASLAAKKAAYDKYLADQKLAFQADKTTQDQTAANNGVLFSGGRVQKLTNLANSYATNDAAKKASVAADIGSTARDFGYKYGDSAASGLSSYFNIGGNSYNPNQAVGGATSGGLSSIYNANQGFQGTEINAAKAAAQKRAAGLLANKGNKLVGSGYTNQF